MLGSFNRGRGVLATKALAVVDSVDMPKSIDALMPVAAAGALVAGMRRPGRAGGILALRDGRRQDQAGLGQQKSKAARGLILNSMATAQLGRALTGGIGTAVSRLSRDKKGPAQTEGYFGREGPGVGPRTVVRTWSSRLTPLLNARDVFGQPGIKVKASGGMMLEHNGKTWHLGETVVETAGGKRHLTHLQSMSAPGAHYFFSGPVNKWEAVGLISGNANYPPRSIPGYAGQITEVESVCPIWANAKQALVKTHLLWGQVEPPRNAHELRQRDGYLAD
jgi:hypothetical protein